MNIKYCIHLSICSFFCPLEILGGLLPHICDLLRFGHKSHIARSLLLNDPEYFFPAEKKSEFNSQCIQCIYLTWTNNKHEHERLSIYVPLWTEHMV